MVNHCRTATADCLVVELQKRSILKILLLVSRTDFPCVVLAVAFLYGKDSVKKRDDKRKWMVKLMREVSMDLTRLLCFLCLK